MLIMNEDELIKLFNDHTFEELIPIISNLLHDGELEEKENDLVAIWTAGWSDDEQLVYCLRDYRCKHHYNYVGSVFAVSYFTKDMEKKHDYHYEIIATRRK